MDDVIQGWPWGGCDHSSIVGANYRIWCFSDHEWCYPPEDGLEYLCRCCKEPLYELRIAELEAEYVECEESNGCYKSDGFIHSCPPLSFSEPGPIRRVFHKVGE